MTTSRTTTASAFQAHSVSDGKGHRRFTRLALALSTALTPVWALADTLPTGGTVVHGSAQIGTPSANTMTITQGSDRAVVNWDGFSIGQGARVDIRQPNADAAILNRVTGDTTSQIHGQLNANGRVFVVNPNGIFIGPTGNVNTGSFVASTLNMRTEDFVTGKTVFEGNGNSATVENAGNVQVVTGGYAALIGGKVKNSGTIQAPLGFVGLGAGERVTLDLSGDGFLQVAVPSDTDDDGLEALIENSGTIQANGGTVQISAATARNAARHAINMSGVVEATTVSGRNGRITLGGGSGGKVTVSGRMRASTRPTIQVTESIRPALRPERGGEITITGRDITLAGASLDTSGENGGGNIRVGGELQGGPGLPTAETLRVDAETAINTDGIIAGDGGRIILWSDVDTTFAGNISARGGASEGNGGFVEVSGKELLSYRGLTDLRAPNGSSGELLLDPSDVAIVADTPGTNEILNSDLVAQLSLGDVIVATDDSGDLPNPFIDFGLAQTGTITVDAPITWATGNTLALAANRDVIVNQPISASAGNLSMFAGNDIELNQSIDVPNGTFYLWLAATSSGEISPGPAGTIDVDVFRINQGDWVQVLNPLPSFSANNFVLDRDPTGTFLRALGGTGTKADPYLLTDVYGLQGVGTVQSGTASFALNNDIDASPAETWQSLAPPVDGQQNQGFVPLDFSGSLDGRRNTISNLFINRYGGTTGFGSAGLFDTLDTSALVTDLSITNADISGRYAGIVAAFNVGSIVGVSTSGSIQVYTNLASWGGGIVAGNVEAEGTPGVIVGSHANVTITDTEDPTYSPPVIIVLAPSTTHYVGGIAGGNFGIIQEVRSSGSVSFDDAITGYAGGLVGNNAGEIVNAYSTANVTGNTETYDNSFAYLGSITGANLGTIENVLANGPVNLIGALGSGSVGAVTGSDIDGNLDIVSSFFNPATTGQTTSGQLSEVDGGGPGPFEGARSLSTAQLNDAFGFYSEASSAGWDFEGIWAIPRDGGDHARLYAVDPVISADDAVAPNLLFDYSVSNAEFQYTASTTGYSAVNSQYFGGPTDYLFGAFGDSGDLTTMDNQIVLSDPNVGEITYRFPTSYTSDLGQVYEVRSLPIPGTVAPAPLTITLGDIEKTYGADLTGSTVSFTAATLFGADTVESVEAVSSGSSADAPVSEEVYPITPGVIAGTGLSNYSISIVPGSLRVIPKALNVELNDAEKTYREEIIFDGTEFSVFGLVNEDTLTSLTIKSEGQPAEAPVADSPYLIDGDDPVGTGLENYDIRIFPGELTLTPAPLTITADDQEKPFGTEFVFTGTEFTVTGLLNEDSVDSATLTSDGAAPDVPLGGEGFVILITDPEGEGLDNYEITFVNGIMIIGPGNLTITANDQSKLYGTELTFDGTEFTVAGLAEGDSVDSVTLNSDGTPVTAQVAGGPYAIIPSDPVGTGLDKYTLFFADGSLTVIQAPLTVTADDQLKQEGQTFTFAGTEFTVTGLLNDDTVDSAVLTSDGATAEALIDDSPFDILIGELTGTGVDNYDVTRVNGAFTVDNIVVPPTVNPIPPWSSTLPNPTDTLTLSLFTSQNRADPVQGNVQGFGGPQQSLGDARTILGLVDSLSSDLELAVQSCGSADQDFTNYMACLSESLDTYANALDEIANDLPPGLEGVAATIRTARDGVNAAAARAQRRLAGTTSEAERRAIRSEALAEARGAVQEAQSEIRKAISLIRADDPEVQAVQRETGARIIQAFDTVDSELARAVEL